MQDYFSEFLLHKNPIGTFASWLGDGATPTSINGITSTCGSNWKLHLIWTVATIAITYTTWKISKWYAGYQIIKGQTSNNQSTPPIKTA